MFILFLPPICAFYRLDAFKFFEPFEDFAKLESYYNSVRIGCNLASGPFCFHLEKLPNVFLTEAAKDIPLNQSFWTNVLIKSQRKKFSSTKHATKQPHQQLDKSIIVSQRVSLTFTSYDDETVKKDTYMPKKKVIQGKAKKLTIYFEGSLRLKHGEKSKEGPEGTYGVIESKCA